MLSSKLKYIAHILREHSIEAVIIGTRIYAMDVWTYRDDTGAVHCAFEWRQIFGVVDAYTFLGY